MDCPYFNRGQTLSKMNPPKIPDVEPREEISLALYWNEKCRYCMWGNLCKERWDKEEKRLT